MSRSCGAVEPKRVSESVKADVADGLCGGDDLPIEVTVVRLVSGISEILLLENTEDGLRDDGGRNPLRTLTESSNEYGGLGYAGDCSL